MVAKFRRKMAVVGALFVLAAGCVALDGQVRDVPTGMPVQAAATWQTYVLFASDPTREGARTPGLAGRLYLFGPQADLPIAAPGRVEVRLYLDTSPDSKASPEAPLEVWRFDPDTLKAKLQHDAIGWGYSLLLPWSTYKPDLTHVRLTVRFEPLKGGAPLFAQETRLTLHGQGPPEVVSTSTTMPTTAAPAASQTTAANVPAKK
jgi:hypothetical protein